MRKPALSTLVWIGLCLITLVLAQYGKAWSKSMDVGWIIKYPSWWVMPIKDDISSGMKWLIEDARIGTVFFIDITRSISWLIEQPYLLVKGFLSTGLLDGIGRKATQILPPLSWIVVISGISALGHYAKDWKLAALIGSCFLYLSVFGQWDSAMITLASVIIAVPLGAIGGLLLGIAAYKHPRFDRLLVPVLDLMQTIPIFAYLVPILFMFGFGAVSALVATIIYAMPPMVRITTLALRNVPPEICDFGVMAGCTERQMTWKILVPSASQSLMLGVNQVIMLSLNMVIIASMIGAGGLGFDVLAALRRLDIGGGFEAGIAIVVLAIAIDRLSQAIARKNTNTHREHQDAGWLKQHPRSVIIIVILLVTFFIGQLLPFLQTWPEGWTLTTGTIWNDTIKYLNINHFDQFEAVKIFFLTYLLLPLKRFFLGLPWPWSIAMLIALGWRIGGWKLALLNGALSVLILVTGMWTKAMITVYLCGAAVVVSSAIGIPIGIWAALNTKVGRVVGVVIDTLQTLPSFVYLIPVVMLFRIGDFTAMVAIVLYALTPAVRYASHGIRNIKPELIEAGIVSGCTPRQLLLRIRLPLALPEILLGINQTIMLALSMVVITALVGTRDLGQEVYIALTKADTGRGIVAGLAIAFIAIIADRTISASAKHVRQRFGMEAAHG